VVCLRVTRDIPVTSIGLSGRWVMGQAQLPAGSVTVVHHPGDWPYRIFLWEAGVKVWELPYPGDDPEAVRVVLGLLYDEMPVECALDRLQELYDAPALGRAALALVESTTPERAEL
jgi:hypothetical protein